MVINAKRVSANGSGEGDCALRRCRFAVQVAGTAIVFLALSVPACSSQTSIQPVLGSGVSADATSGELSTADDVSHRSQTDAAQDVLLADLPDDTACPNDTLCHEVDGVLDATDAVDAADVVDVEGLPDIPPSAVGDTGDDISALQDDDSDGLTNAVEAALGV